MFFAGSLLATLLAAAVFSADGFPAPAFLFGTPFAGALVTGAAPARDLVAPPFLAVAVRAVVFLATTFFFVAACFAALAFRPARPGAVFFRAVVHHHDYPL